MNTSSHSILLVEDDADDRYIMHLAFAELGYEEHVKIIDNPEGFLKYLKSLPHSSLYPSLVVIDFNMPRMNGGEVLMRLKMDEALREIPVAIYSTGMRNMVSRLKAMGSTYCFEKGTDFNDVYKLALNLIAIVEGNEVQEKVNF